MQIKLFLLAILFSVTFLSCNTQHKNNESETKSEEMQHATPPENATIKGTLLDSKTEKPIGMANIIIVGTTTGTLTSEDGKFTITVPSTAKKLFFSASGYEAKKVDITKDKEMIVKLSRAEK